MEGTVNKDHVPKQDINESSDGEEQTKPNEEVLVEETNPTLNIETPETSENSSLCSDFENSDDSGITDEENEDRLEIVQRMDETVNEDHALKHINQASDDEDQTKPTEGVLVEETSPTLDFEKSETSENSSQRSDHENFDDSEITENEDSGLENAQSIKQPTRTDWFLKLFSGWTNWVWQRWTDEPEHTTQDRSFEALLKDLHLNPKSKLTLKTIRTVDNHTLSSSKLTSPEQIPGYILKSLMIVNYHAREFKLNVVTPDSDKSKSKDNESDGSEDNQIVEQCKNQKSEINPMDALLAIFHCSDDFLRRDLAIKMSACQLSVPFLLPNPEAPSDNVTILLWALESITKSWKGASNNKESAQQVFATEYPFPVVSFVRIGKNTLSKSLLMNQIISDANGNHNFFFHKDMKGGDVQRRFVDGLVELAWYLPGGSEEQILQSEICFANLRGDAKYFKKQLNVLLKISSVLCLLLPSENPDSGTKIVLDEITNFRGKVILVFNDKRSVAAEKYFNGLKNYSENVHLITRANKANEYSFLQSIRESIQKSMHAVKAISLEEFKFCAGECGTHLDGNQLYFRFGKNIDSWLELGVKAAKDLLILQKHVPVLAELERDKSRPKRYGNKSHPEHVDQISGKICKKIEKEKNAQKKSFVQMDERVCHYLNCIAVMDETQRNYALTKLKHQLDKLSIMVMTKLHHKYRAASFNFRRVKRETRENQSDVISSEEKHLKELEKAITECSFGSEHILREVAQLYQLTDVSTNDYAGAATEMLLSGQPLELLDGDSSYIPLRWFKAVYSKLERVTNNAKIFVISVLGIQSSGKSTMLNTMFGLEFAVSAGRCTRGAFASLIPVSQSIKTASNVEYILIIDTEGLRGSGNLEQREHDNELATFVIGVADVIIVNIFGENHNEMKEFLQIAVHAFLKMRLVKEKKTCKIVHQNVLATDAKEKLIVERLNLKSDLDEMAKLAATQENCEDQFKKFDDIISFDEHNDVFYIPSYLKGNPPMAPVNPDYGRAVQGIKENIILSVYSSQNIQTSISQFQERVCNLWQAMLKENFIFSFRNTIEVRAFTSLDRKYFEESVNLLVIGMAEVEREVHVALSRCTMREERESVWEASTIKIREDGEKLEEDMKNAMRTFFETNEDKATLEQWRENVMNKIVELKESQITDVTKNCFTAFNYLQNRQEVDQKRQKYEKKLIQTARKFIMSVPDKDKDSNKCKKAFKREWKQWIKKVPPCKERKIDVNTTMIKVLCNTDLQLNTDMTAKLKECGYFILNFKETAPIVDRDQLNVSYVGQLYNFVAQQQHQQCISTAKIIKDQAIDVALNFAKKTSESGVRCKENDLKQMYQKVIATINKETVKHRFNFRKGLTCDILLYTFANAYEIFDEMEKRYFKERDIRGELERDLRPKLEKYFLNLCSEMEKEVLAATSIVDVLQQPIEAELSRTMGPVVARTLLKDSKYQSKGQFHARVLIQLGEDCQFKSYIPYLENSVRFLRSKLKESIENYCLKDQRGIITSLLQGEAKKIEDKVFAAILTASEKFVESKSDKLTFWIQRFVENCSTLEITKEKFSVATIEDELKDIDVFVDAVRENVKEFLQSLVEHGVDHAVMQRWNPSPHDQLFISLFGCEKCCPFCHSLCDQTIQNHSSVHSTKVHQPQGLTGCRNVNTNMLDTSICTSCVASEASFSNRDTLGEWRSYKDYKLVNDYYKSWSIPSDSGFEAPKYWKWFMAMFSKELSEHYNVEQPEISSDWKEIKFEHVKGELEREYQL